MTDRDREQVEALLASLRAGRQAGQLLSDIERARRKLDKAEERFGEGALENEREKLDELERDVRRLAGD